MAQAPVSSNRDFPAGASLGTPGWRHGPTPASPRDLPPGAPAGADVPQGCRERAGRPHPLGPPRNPPQAARACCGAANAWTSSSTGAPHPHSLPASSYAGRCFPTACARCQSVVGRATRDSKCCQTRAAGRVRETAGAKGIAVLPLFPIFRHFFHFHQNLLISSAISGTFSRENRFPQKRQKRPKIAKHTKHEPLPKRDAIFASFP